MPMAIELMMAGMFKRRQLLLATAALAFGTRTLAAPSNVSSTVLATAWVDARGRHHIGLLRSDARSAKVVASIEVPTRAHGLACTNDGCLLAVARRPGDWLLRWRPDSATKPDWIWADGDRRFNGHVLASPDGESIYTTEIELESGRGQLVRRDAASLAQTAIWPTQGLDPHDMEWLPGQQLLVANGGIQTLPETGRVKRHLDQMDSSLVRIDLRSGGVNGVWRLADSRLSIRHLARHPSGMVGAALQAEHDELELRATAPLLALFDPAAATLQPITQAHSASGYAGDVAALNSGWLLSCPRENQVQRLTTSGDLKPALQLESACALAADADSRSAWITGGTELWRSVGGQSLPTLPAGNQFDNHAILWRG